MSYVICVALKRKGSVPPQHIFRTAPDSILCEEKAVEIAKQLRTVYPTGLYHIDISRWETTGKEIAWEE